MRADMSLLTPKLEVRRVYRGSPLERKVRRLLAISVVKALAASAFGLLPSRFRSCRQTLAEGSSGYDILIHETQLEITESNSRKLSELVSQARGQCCHRAIPPGRPQPTLPNRENAPSEIAQCLLFPRVTRTVRHDLRPPIVNIRARRPPLPALVTMPEATVDEDGSPIFRENQVGRSWKAVVANHIAKAEPVEGFAKRDLGLRVRPLHALHQRGSTFGRDRVHGPEVTSEPSGAEWPRSRAAEARRRRSISGCQPGLAGWRRRRRTRTCPGRTGCVPLRAE